MADKSEKIIKVIGTDDMEMMFEDDFEEDNKKLIEEKKAEEKIKAKKIEKEIFEDSNKNKFMLEVNEKNVKALKLYEKIGFERISVRKNYYGKNENAMIMMKIT